MNQNIIIERGRERNITRLLDTAAVNHLRLKRDQ